MLNYALEVCVCLAFRASKLDLISPLKANMKIQLELNVSLSSLAVNKLKLIILLLAFNLQKKY